MKKFNHKLFNLPEIVIVYWIKKIQLLSNPVLDIKINDVGVVLGISPTQLKKIDVSICDFCEFKKIEQYCTFNSTWRKIK